MAHCVVNGAGAGGQECRQRQTGGGRESGAAGGAGHGLRSPHERARGQGHGQTDTRHALLLLVSTAACTPHTM